MNDLANSELRKQAHAGDGAAQYRLAQAYFLQNKTRRGVHWLRSAAGSKNPNAMTALALRFLTNRDVERNLPEAYRLLEGASASGFTEATYQLSTLFAAGFATKKDIPKALEHLQKAANADHPAALRTLGMLYSMDNSMNQGERAVATLLKAAHLGDGIAAYFAAESLLATGEIRDHGRARHLLEQASRENIGLAQRRLVTLNTEGTLPNAEPPDALWQSYDPLVIAPGWDTSRTARHQQLSNDPPIFCFDSMLTAQECEYIVAIAEPDMRASMVMDAAGRPIRDSLRTSYSTEFLSTLRDMVIHLIECRMVSVTNAPISNAETLGVLRYNEGEEYKQHVDFLSQASLDSPFGETGQRLNTIFVYLSEVTEGGETIFPQAGASGVKIGPKMGCGVLFQNIKKDGAGDPRSVHASLPVKQGTKWLATLWLRDKPFQNR